MVPLVHEAEISGDVERGQHTRTEGAMYLEAVLDEEVHRAEELEGESQTSGSGRGRCR